MTINFINFSKNRYFCKKDKILLIRILRTQLRENPFLRVLIPFYIGIWVCDAFLNPFPKDFFYLFAFLGVLSLLVSIISYLKYSYKTNIVWGIAISVILFLFGICNYTIKNQYSLASRKQGTFEGIVVNNIKQKDIYFKTIVKARAIDNITNKTFGDEFNILITIHKDSMIDNLMIGSKIIFNTSIDSLTYSGNPYSFNYAKYMASSGVYYKATLNYKHVYKIGEFQDFDLQLLALKVRNIITEKLKKYNFPDETYSVINAFVLGEKAYLDSDLMNAYSNTGTIHILAVSGTHVGILNFLLLSLFGFLKRNKKELIFKAVLVIGLIWFYTFLTGLAPSIMRAACMFSFVTLGSCLNRKNYILNSMGASLFVILFVNPQSISDLGMYLSFLAVLGIVLLYKPLQNLFFIKNKLLYNIWGTVAVSIVATVAVTPLTLFYFNKFSFSFLISNIIIVPISSVLLPIGLILCVLMFFPIYIDQFIAILTDYIVRTMDGIVYGLNNIPYGCLDGIAFSKIEMYILFLSIIFFCSFLMLRYNRHLRIAFLFLIALFCFRNILFFSIVDKSELVIYNSTKGAIIHLIDKNNNIVVSDLSKTEISYYTKPIIDKTMFKPNKNYIFKPNDSQKGYDFDLFNNVLFYKKIKILIFDDYFISHFEINKLSLDYILIKRLEKYSNYNSLKYIKTKKYIFDSSLSSSMSENIIKKNNLDKTKCFIIRKSGAYNIII